MRAGSEIRGEWLLEVIACSAYGMRYVASFVPCNIVCF